MKRQRSNGEEQHGSSSTTKIRCLPCSGTSTIRRLLLILCFLVYYYVENAPVAAAFTFVIPTKTTASKSKWSTSSSGADTSSSSSTQLFGLRSKAKEKISSLKEKLKTKPTSSRTLRLSTLTAPKKKKENEKGGHDIPELMPLPEVGATPAAEELISVQEGGLSKDNSISLMTMAEGEEELKAGKEDDFKSSKHQSIISTVQLPNSTAPFLKLPPRNNSYHTQLTKAEQEFRDMILFYERYSQRDVDMLASYRLRVVMQGMAASTVEPAVYRAFEVLYQDLPPLRVAGRLIFKRLRHVMSMCVQARRDEIQSLVSNFTTTGSINISQSDLEAAQYYFLLLIEATTATPTVDDAGINNDREHEIIMPVTQLKDSALAQLLVEKFHLENVHHLLHILDPESTGEMDFPQFILGLEKAAVAHQALPVADRSFDPKKLLEELLAHAFKIAGSEDNTNNKNTSSGRRNTRVLDPQRQAYSDRYEEMLDVFREWKHLVPTGPGRRLDVLRGCFVGAQNDAIREALRIVYVDVTAMRMAGNTIFALMSALIPQQRRNNNERR
jgi:hypothetical protein